MKKILSTLLALIFLIPSLSVHALTVTATTNTTESSDLLDITKYNPAKLDTNLTVRQLLYVYFSAIGEGIPESYQYIKLEFTNVHPGTSIYRALQKWVYLDLIKNRPIALSLDKPASEEVFARMIKTNFDEEITFTIGAPLKLRTLINTLNTLNAQKQAEIEASQRPEYAINDVSNFPILNDAFLKLRESHYDSASFSDEKLIQWAIKGLAEGTGDKYTTYFPPVESKEFHDELDGQFEGVGAYVDMQIAGELRVISPLSGSPAEKAGMKGWDRILKIDNYEITENTTLTEAVRRIKWPSGTTVSFVIDRGGNTINLSVVRAKIIVEFVQGKKLDNGDYYIKITTFGNGVAQAFKNAVKTMATSGSQRKIIIDLRNNPGGSLDEVSSILNLFVPKDQSVVQIRLKNFATDTYSLGENLYDFSSTKFVILINEWSASASEIMAGTIKDYIPNMVLLGEKSYGKWSVQTLSEYEDGSSIKYTIAKWFTGKTRTGIDGKGIKPDIEIKFDEVLFKQGIDNQLEAAKRL